MVRDVLINLHNISSKHKKKKKSMKCFSGASLANSL